MKQKWLGIVFVVGVLVVPLAVRYSSAGAVTAIETELAARHVIRSSILASGNLVYEEQALLSPEIIGKVTRILAKEGEHVTQGQIVMQLEEKGYRAEVTQQQAAVKQQRIALEQNLLNVGNNERQYERKKDLVQRKFIADAQFDDARFALESSRIEVRNRRESLLQAEAVLAQSHERLAKTNIRAPITGTVIAVDIKTGETAVPSTMGIAGSGLMTIANTDTILTEINVDEADIAKVQTGQEVSITVAAYPDVRLKGRLETLPLAAKRQEPGARGGNGGSLGRNYAIKVKIDNAAGLALRPGMTCRAEIFTASTAKSVAVPIQAVLNNNDEKDQDSAAKARKSGSAPKTVYYVMVDNNGVAARRVVKTGLSDDIYQEILDGISVNDKVIVGPYKLLRHLKQGDPVKSAEPQAVARK